MREKHVCCLEGRKCSRVGYEKAGRLKRMICCPKDLHMVFLRDCERKYRVDGILAAIPTGEYGALCVTAIFRYSTHAIPSFNDSNIMEKSKRYNAVFLFLLSISRLKLVCLTTTRTKLSSFPPLSGYSFSFRYSFLRSPTYRHAIFHR